MFFPFVCVMIEPKAYRLHIAVPRVFGGVGMAVIASSLHECGHMFGYLVICGNVKIVNTRFIFFHGHKLDAHQDDDNGECDFF